MIRSVSILIATHNRDELLAQTLESLAKVREAKRAAKASKKAASPVDPMSLG